MCQIFSIWLGLSGHSLLRVNKGMTTVWLQTVDAFIDQFVTVYNYEKIATESQYVSGHINQQHYFQSVFTLTYVLNYIVPTIKVHQ